MPFDDLETITKENMPPTATVTYDHATDKGKRGGKKPRLTISVPSTVCGTAKSERFKLQLGSGVDTGKLRISAVRDGGVKPSEHAHFFRWNFGYVPRLGSEETFAAEKCPVKKITDDVFEITVPASWFAPNE